MESVITDSVALSRSNDRILSSTSTSRMGIATTLAVIGITARLLSFLVSRNTGGDALVRVALTANWLEHPKLRLIFDSYPAGHFWLIGGVALLFHNVEFAGRLLSLVLGIGSLLLVWKLAVMLYGETAGIFSLSVMSLYTMHIAYSTTSSSEISYLFFLLVSLFFLFSYLRAEPGQLGYMFLSGLSLSISESIRFEAWVFFVGMLLLLGYLTALDSRGQRKLWDRGRAVLAFGITGAVWPVLLMVYCYRNFGDPMYLVNWTHIRVQQLFATQPSSLGYEFSLMPAVLLISLSPLAVAAAIYGWVKSFRLPLPRALAAIVLFFFVVQNYQLLRGATVAVARYTLTIGTLLAIFSGYGFALFCRKSDSSRMRLAMIAVPIFLVGNCLAVLAISEVPNRYADKFASVSPRLRYPTRIAEVGEYLKTHLSHEDALVIDDYNEEPNVLANASGLPLLTGDRVYQQGAKNAIGAREYINERRPRFLVYSDAGTLRSSLSLPKNCGEEADFGSLKFHCVFANQLYRVYELSYAGSARLQTGSKSYNREFLQ